MRYFIFLIGLALLTCAACSDNGTPPEVGNVQKPFVSALINSEVFSGEWDDVDPPETLVPTPGISCSGLANEVFYNLTMRFLRTASFHAEGTYPTDSCTLELGYIVYEQSNAGGSITFSKIGDELVEGSFSVTLIDPFTQSEFLMTGSFTGDLFLPGEFQVIFELNAESYTCENGRLYLPLKMRCIRVMDGEFNSGEDAHINIAVFSVDQSWVGDYDFNRSDTEARVIIGHIDSELFLATDGQLTVSSTDSIPLYSGEDLVGYEYIIGTGNFHFTASSNEVPPKIITVTDGLVDINGLD